MIPLIIIPKYGCIIKIAEHLKKISSFENELEEVKHVMVINTEIEESNLGKLSELKDYIDLIVVYTLTKTVLDDCYKTLSSDKFDINEKFVFYSPNAHHHRGKMSHSSKSGAKYEWIIYRTDGKKPVVLLLQHLEPNKKTSYHYHKKTLEFFLPLAGKTIIRLGDKEKNLEKGCFTKVGCEVCHQLRTANGTALNCLCMEPYDADMKDHYYE